ncbi:MAG: hypothetical protein ACREMR_03740 [Gemmatimonadales bacterium]
MLDRAVRGRGLMLVAALAASAVSAQGAPPTAAPGYRGFTPGMTYRDFADRARQLQRRQPLVCNTSRRTAHLMECGVRILDPADSASFYLGAFVLEGQVALLSFGDSGDVALVERRQRELTEHYGAPRATGFGTWEWQFGRQVVRLNWRGRGERRWLYVAIWDSDILDGIGRYAKRPSAGKP